MSHVDWKDFIPLPLVPLVQCGCLDNFSDDDLSAIVCTKTQQLLEIAGTQVIGSCNLSVSNCKRVSIFYSYNPDFKYYLVESDRSLCVIRKTETLEVFKFYDNVENVEIRDDFNAGFPQVSIRLFDEFEPLITDFTDKDFTDSYAIKEAVSAQSEFVLSLSSNLQDMKLKLEQAKEKLKEKRKLRISALHNFTESSVNVKGDIFHKFPSKRSEIDSAGIVLGETWQKIHQDKWIIGVDFKTTKSEVTNLALILDADEYSSQLLRLNKDSKGDGFCWIRETHDPLPKDFEPVSMLPPNSCAHYLAVQNRPCRFMNSSSVSVTGVITYQVENRTFQAVISSISLKVNSFLSNNLQPFSNDSEKVQDLLAVLGTSESIAIKICLPHSFETSIEQILCDKLNFKLLKKFGYFFNGCISNIGLFGMMVYSKLLTPTIICASIYGRDADQIILFLNCLSGFLPHGTLFSKFTINSSSKTVEDGLESLKSELKLLAITMENHSDGETIKIPASQWKLMRKNLHQLELNTDMIISDLSVKQGTGPK